MTATFHVGDVVDIMGTLADNSVDLVLTSPPFLALRSYLLDDHPDKTREIGSEATPAEFLDTLLALTAEWERLLAPHGSIAVELGDTYAGSGGGGGGDYLPGGLRENQPGFGGTPERQREGNAAHWRAKNRHRDAWPLAKSLCILPELYAASLAYGRNVLTGVESPAGQWRVRNLVRWVRPNPPVGALGDKYRPATSTMVVACKATDRWFDLDAVRSGEQTRPGGSTGRRRLPGDDRADTLGPYENTGSHPAGAPPLDWWNIPTHSYKGAHYATWPPALCERPIKSMCPQHVCRECGEPRRRIVEKSREYAAFRASKSGMSAGDHTEHRRAIHLANKGGVGSLDHGEDAGARGQLYETLGWTDCGHDDYRPGVVLDPFAGSGTTLAVATGHGRDAIGIDIDERNADLAAERVGPMLIDVIRREAAP